MLKVVDNESTIRRHQRQFVRAFRGPESETVAVRLGHPGASDRARVIWSERLGLWAYFRKIAGNRYWNAFGIEKPAEGATLPITCEINFPLCGIDRRTGGAFAADREGRIFVVHRGKLGGGRKGVGKSLFESRYRGVWQVMDDGGEETLVAVIGVLDSPRFARQIAAFARKIARIKDEAVAAGAAQTELGFAEPELHEEWLGERYREPRDRTDIACDRGVVFGDLAAALRERGWRIASDEAGNLLVRGREDRVLALFQAPERPDRAGLLAAAAGLLLDGVDLAPGRRLVLAVPASPEEAGMDDPLQRLGIDLLPYEWDGDRALFPALEELLAKFP